MNSLSKLTLILSTALLFTACDRDLNPEEKQLLEDLRIEVSELKIHQDDNDSLVLLTDNLQNKVQKFEQKKNSTPNIMNFLEENKNNLTLFFPFVGDGEKVAIKKFDKKNGIIEMEWDSKTAKVNVVTENTLSGTWQHNKGRNKDTIILSFSAESNYFKGELHSTSMTLNSSTNEISRHHKVLPFHMK